MTAERHVLPLYKAQANGWKKGARLPALIAQECTSRDLLAPDSLVVRGSAAADAATFRLNVDYSADLSWGTGGRLSGGRISETTPESALRRVAAAERQERPRYFSEDFG
ncbi:MAG: hypothetical protein JSS27_03510 [Planctomycetes bacterium]|nr:hypothetical protein [Planctomycetota bacterium]